MADQLQEIKKSIDVMNKNVSAIAKATQRSQHQQALSRATLDVDALTNGEVAELARLAGSPDVHAASAERASDPVFAGMYSELSRLGLVTLDWGGTCVALTPMAHWAIEKRRQRDGDSDAARAKQWKHDKSIAVVSAAIGGVLGIAGSTLGVLAGRLLG